MAVNRVIFGGFSQNFVFDHHIDGREAEKIASLFRSLYFELSFVEMARLVDKATAHVWFPISLVVQKFGWQPTEIFFSTATALLKTPTGFQNWCAEKKMHPQDLSPLLSAGDLDLKWFYRDLLTLKLSKSQGTRALELAVELSLMGNDVKTLEAQDNESSAEWLERLTLLRYPETSQRDADQESWMTTLPWPGTSQARWTRQGDRAGVEVKLFVSQPSDLKKYLQGLSRVQDLLEKDRGQKH
ncbi:MAG: hypothetical protein COT73_01175 [Bdellovibrio sp. CG10_big_fil_rev_8_21_14_0_10_47_8]|nr:MAG: hypothetical protein COT73_01175 [Bdellovibrio sp. CG10_big_fil_rev_8_21_14_0_10_47_8]